jgi:hypothetical protein
MSSKVMQEIVNRNLNFYRLPLVFSLFFSHNFWTRWWILLIFELNLYFVLAVILSYYSLLSVEFKKSYRDDTHTHTHTQTHRHDHSISPLVGLKINLLILLKWLVSSFPFTNHFFPVGLNELQGLKPHKVKLRIW